MSIFKPKRDQKETDIYDRRRGLARNRSMCMLAAGLLVYQTIQVFFESQDMPWWFIPAMAGMIGVVILVIIRNGKLLKETDEEIARIEAEEQAKALEVAESDDEVVDDDNEEYEEDAYDDDADDDYDDND